MANVFALPWRPLLEGLKTAPGGQVYFTLAGTNTPTNTYSDNALTTPRTNPVIADGNGKVPTTYMDTAVSYRVRVYGRTAVAGVDSPLEEYDPYTPGFWADATSARAAIGYIAGAGGAVTQATSKATGVTLSKASGQITLNAAALAAAAKVSFVVTNTYVAATDTIVVNVASGGTANAYRAAVTAVGAGSFTITVENITAGPLSEAPVINFAILKATAS